MDTDEEIVKPSNMEIQNFSKEDLTTIPLIVPLISEKIPDLVEATHSLDNSRFSSTSSKAQIQQIDTDLKKFDTTESPKKGMVYPDSTTLIFKKHS